MKVLSVGHLQKQLGKKHIGLPLLVLGAVVLTVAITLLVVNEHNHATTKSLATTLTSKTTPAEKSQQVNGANPQAGNQSSPPTTQSTSNSNAKSSSPQNTVAKTNSIPASTTVAPTPITVAPTPTTLPNCINPDTGQSCPYNPPASWSDSVQCINSTSGYAPCPSYSQLTSYFGDFNGQVGVCYFRFAAYPGIQKIVPEQGSYSSSSYPDCLTAQAQ